MSDGSGSAFGGGSGGTVGSGTGGQIAVGGESGHGVGGMAGSSTSPPGSGGIVGAAGSSGSGGTDSGGPGGTTGSGGGPGTAGMSASGGKGSAVASGGMPAAGSGGRAGAGGGGTVGSGGTASGGTVGTGGAPSASGGTVGAGGGAGGAGTSGAGGAPTDAAKLSFETSSQSWFVAAGTFANLGRSTVRHFAGIAALGATLQYTAGSAGVTNTLAVGNLGSITPPGPGSVITFHVYLPASAAAIDWIQPFLQDSTLAYFGAYTLRQSLTFGAWNTIKLTVPSTATSTLHLLGVEFRTSGGTSLSDDVFIDSVDW